MWDRVLQVLSGTRRFSLLLKALKAFGLCLILSLYNVIVEIMVVTAGVMGRSIMVIMVVMDRDMVICFDFIRHGVFALFVFGEIVSDIV